jgi:serine/threonine protein kinase
MSGNAVASIEELCGLLCRSRLLAAEEVESLARRWQSEAQEPDSLAEFARWLVTGHLVTEYQMARLLRGRAHNFFFGDYKLLAQVGRGKHTAVYRAVDRVGIVVAVKVLPASGSRDALALARFRREARLGRQLEHPNVVRVLESGEQHGAHYLLMEYLEGETLQQTLVSRGRLSPAEATELALQALAGVQHLHERGIIHRNLEPANLLLVRAADPTDPPLVKVLDLSLSLVPGEEDPPAGGHGSPEEETFPAAPAYLAPELAFDPRTADRRSDIFSLGRILYHALAGKPPLPGPVSPLLQVHPAVPEELAGIVARMMAPDPAQRFSSTVEAMSSLRAFLDRQALDAINVEPLSWLEDHTQPASVPVAVAPPPPPLPPVTPVPALLSEMGARPAPEDVVAAVGLRRPQHRGLLDRRDWLMLLAGAGSLLLAQALAWGLGRLIAALREPANREEVNDQSPS